MSQQLFSTKRQTHVGPEPGLLGSVQVMRGGKAVRLSDLCGIRKGERFRLKDRAGHWGPWMIAVADAELRTLRRNGYGKEMLAWGINAKPAKTEEMA